MPLGWSGFGRGGVRGLLRFAWSTVCMKRGDRNFRLLSDVGVIREDFL